jgi:hypothetical protein
MSTAEETLLFKEKRESELKLSAKRAEKILQDRLSQYNVLAETEVGKGDNSEFKE